MDENESLYLNDNIAQFAPSTTDTQEEGFMESNMMHGNRRIWPKIFGTVTHHFTILMLLVCILDFSHKRAHVR